MKRLIYSIPEKMDKIFDFLGDVFHSKFFRFVIYVSTATAVYFTVKDL